MEPSTDARPRRNAVTPSSETLSWLPPGWVVEDRVRASGATAGLVDRYYTEPSTGLRFRSKKEVLYYLETGTLRKNKKEPVKSAGDNNSSGNSQRRANKSGASTKTADFKFDFENVPESVVWVLTNAKDDIWTPFIAGEKVPDHEKRSWDTEFASLTTNK